MENPTSNSIANLPLNQLTTIIHLKLKDDNFLTWKSLMLPVIHKFRLMKFLDVRYPCPVQYTNTRNENNDVENPEYSTGLMKM